MNLSKLVYVEKYGREWQRNWEADHDTIEFIEKELEKKPNAIFVTPSQMRLISLRLGSEMRYYPPKTGGGNMLTYSGVPIIVKR